MKVVVIIFYINMFEIDSRKQFKIQMVYKLEKKS